MSEFEIDLALVGGIERQPLRLRGSENSRLSRKRRARQAPDHFLELRICGGSIGTRVGKRPFPRAHQANRVGDDVPHITDHDRRSR